MFDLNTHFCAALVMAFAHFLWQAGFIGVVFALAMRALDAHAAKTRYACGLASLCVLSVCVPVTFALIRSAEPDSNVAARSTASAIAVVPVPNPVGAIHSNAIDGLPDLGLNEPYSTTYTDQPIAAAKLLTWDLQQWAPWMLILYALGVAGVASRLLLGITSGRALRRNSKPITAPPLVAAIARVARRVGLTTVPAVRWCETTLTPAVVGVVRPVLLLPLACASGMSPEAWEQVLHHEFTHIRRRDHIVNFLQNTLEALLFFHPVVWYISRRVRLEREFCCDAAVVADTSNATAYAELLIDMAQRVRGTTRTSELSAVAMTSSKSQLSQRVERLLSRSDKPHSRARGERLIETASLLAIATVLGACLLFAFQRPVVAAKPVDDFVLKILVPDGTPAQGARVVLATAESQVMLKNGEFTSQTYATLDKTTDAVGQVSFPPQAEAFKLFITHKSGYAEVAIDPQQPLRGIQLAAWGGVEGELHLGESVGAGVKLVLYCSSKTADAGLTDATHAYETRSDEQGHYAFSRVVPGTALLGRQVITHRTPSGHQLGFSHAISIQVEAGKSLTVNLGGNGIALVGTLLAPKGLTEPVDWNFTSIQIEQVIGLPPPIPYPQGLKDAEKQAWLQKWFTTPPALAWVAASNAYEERNQARGRYVAAVDEEGAFRIDDVPPGNYSFSMKLHENGAGTNENRYEMIGQLQFDFQIPSQADGLPMFDLGQLQVEPAGKK